MNRIRRLGVFCGSSGGNRTEYRVAAGELGRRLAQGGYGLVYGGASVGLMGALAEAALAHGGEVIGVLPNWFDRPEIAYPGLTRLEIVFSLHERKALIAELSDAFIALPGGFGTYEELFEVVTASQLGLQRCPIGLLNVAGFFDPLLQQIEQAIAAGFIKPIHRELLVVAESPEQLLDQLLHQQVPIASKWVDTPELNARSSLEEVPTRAGYDRWSAVYDEEENPLVLLETRLVAPWLGEVRGLRVLDAGCGTGRYSLPMAAAGAWVVGADFSEGMLRRAHAKAGAQSVRFVVHDLARVLPFASASFDRVLCSLVCDHIPDLAPLMEELRRVCRKDGAALVSVMHPALMLRGIQARFREPATGNRVAPQSYPHQISDYVAGALAAGWRLTRLSEHAMDEATARGAPRARKYLGWPMLLLMQLRR